MTDCSYSDQLDSMMLNMNIDKAMFVEATDQDTFVKALSDKRRIIVVNIQKFWNSKKPSKKPARISRICAWLFLLMRYTAQTPMTFIRSVFGFCELQDIFDENGGFITRGSTKKNLIVGFTATPSDRVLARIW